MVLISLVRKSSKEPFTGIKFILLNNPAIMKDRLKEKLSGWELFAGFREVVCLLLYLKCKKPSQRMSGVEFLANEP
jgi:hypothetical protein